jgi:cell division septation protein DedD
MSEPEVHEIQLNGKQLVFMFGAAVVVSVVIFLCGVMVGRGVRQPQAELLAATTTDTPVDSQLPFDAPGARPSAPADPAPAPEQEDVTYGNRLEAAAPLDEPLRPVQVPKPAVTPAVAEKPALPEPASNTSFAEPPGNGHVVQVMAFPGRADAEALARRLGAKGYPTFVTSDGPGRTRYRVRVGKYPNRRDAEAIALRLRQEERFDPWLPPR